MKKKAKIIVKQNKLKVCMLGHKRIPSREGGIEIVVEELATRMVERGHSVTCYNRRGHHVGGKEFDGSQIREYKNVRIKTVPTIERKGLAATTSSFFASICAAFGDYDVVHYHAEGPAAMCWLPKLFGKKIVFTCHGIDWMRDKWRGTFAQKYIKFGEKCAVKYADGFIVLSEGVQAYFRENYGRETTFIPNGVTRPQLRLPVQIAQRWGLEKDSYILFLGRIVPEKGIHYLVDAYKSIDTDKKLVIAGGSSDTDEYMRQLQQKAKDDNRIIFTGFVQGQLLEELYSNAYIYVLPSDLEGMPLSLLEAMSYGNCCLTSDIAECAEVVEDKAITFKKSDMDDLKDKLDMLCRDKKAVGKYKDEAADFICGKYSWDDIVGQTLELYVS